jgi:2-polyprenyl-6-methoxyphenol hydroxylase-like FAD-dependent oxidoreductase
MTFDSTTSVLIVGGSLNGLSAALLLAHRGVPCIVVERHPRTSIQYKFRGISPRTMEIYRSLGIEDEIRARHAIDDRSASVARMKNLADAEIHWQGIPWSDTSDLGPTPAATCDQDQLEPILRAHAERLGADIRFNTELTGFVQGADGVAARVRERSAGVEQSVRAGYLIAADGTRSPVREALGIGRHGPGVLQHWMNVIFETDLPTTLDGRPVRSVFVTDINGTFVPRGDGRWLMAVQYVPERGERPEDFTPDRCRDLIRRAAGRSDLPVQIVDARPWEAAAAIADRFCNARVFLVGDSAHVMPPTGGFGGNTGVQDAFNLAWKLDAVIRRAAGPRLLDTGAVPPVAAATAGVVLSDARRAAAHDRRARHYARRQRADRRSDRRVDRGHAAGGMDRDPGSLGVLSRSSHRGVDRVPRLGHRQPAAGGARSGYGVKSRIRSTACASRPCRIPTSSSTI